MFIKIERNRVYLKYDSPGSPSRYICNSVASKTGGGKLMILDSISCHSPATWTSKVSIA